jgi:hypothetical protein
MKQIAEVKYSEQDDPSFYLFLDRLDKAALFKESHRVDGRTALDSFVTGENSLRYQKMLK